MSQYKYFAFISYTRKNSRAAAFVQRRLEHFRIPLKHVAIENRLAKGRVVRPVFQDKLDLDVSVGSFTSDIRKARAHPTGCLSGLEYLAPWNDGFYGYLDFMDLGITFAQRNKEIIDHLHPIYNFKG